MSAQTQRPVRHAALGAAMRRTRERARPQLSGSALARLLGWNQAKVSLIESGRQTPTERDVRAWAAATGASADTLLGARDRALTRNLDVRTAARFPGGVEAMQGDVETIEAGSTTIAEYQPTLLPGLVQTSAYTRAWLTQAHRVSLAGALDVELIVSRRADRQRRLADRALTVAVPPSVLDAVYGAGPDGVTTQVRQLDALDAMVADGRVALYVAVRPLAVLHGFELLDDAVLIETVAGVQVLADAEIVRRFRRALDRVRSTGVTGPGARELIAAARARLTSR